ncbi:MAG: transglutaminase family protein [Steroidobacteraceae bacterium]
MSAPLTYEVRHSTRYNYGGEVAHAHQLLHLTPRETPTQHTEGHAILVRPVALLRATHEDAFGNAVTRLELDRPHRELEIIASMRVRVSPPPFIDAAATLPWEEVAAQLRYQPEPCPAEQLDALRFRWASPYVPVKAVFAAYARECFAAGAPLLACAEKLMHRIHHDFRYVPGATQISTPLLEVLAGREGVCQDFAHVMIAALRSLGLAARYVSGYLRTRPPEGEPGRIGADASHAWVSVYVPPLGWVDLDPTNNLRVAQEHVVLAWGRDFGDVSPLRGVLLGGGSHQLTVGVSVTEAVDDIEP